MNREEAKFILAACRPNGKDTTDPQVAEALTLLEADAELAKWFAESQTFDTAVKNKLNAVSIPSDLKANILAGQKVIRPRVWWQQRPILAIAASVVLLLGLGGVWLYQNQNSSLTAYRQDMANFVATQLTTLDMFSRDVQEVKQHLTKVNAHADFQLSLGLQQAPSVGCRVLDWKGHKVSLICFFTDDGGEVHLFVMDRKAMPEASAAPEFATVGEITTATWQRGDKTYLLAGYGGRDELVKYL